MQRYNATQQQGIVGVRPKMESLYPVHQKEELDLYAKGSLVGEKINQKARENGREFVEHQIE